MVQKYFLLKMLLIIEVIYFGLSTLVPGVPGWKMFSSFERVQFVVHNSKTQTEVSVNHYLPPTYYSLNEASIKELVRFACKKDLTQLTLKFEKDAKSYVFTPPICDPN